MVVSKEERYWSVKKVLLVVLMIPLVLVGGCVLLVGGCATVGVMSNPVSDWNSNSGGVSSKETNSPLSVKLTSVKPSEYDDYSVDVLGEITNNGDSSISKYKAEVSITCRDSKGTLVGTDTTFADPSIAAHGSAPFKTYIDVTIPARSVESCGVSIV